MSRYIASVSVIAVLFLAGCSERESTISDGKEPRIGAAAMIEHLRGQNLPVLKSLQTWQNDYGPGLKLVTEHYEVYTTLLEPLMLSQIPGFLESAYRGYNRQLAEPIETERRFTVYLFASRQQWEDFTGTFGGRQAPILLKLKDGAYYLNGACVAYNIGRERTFSVLGHEGWHQFNSRHFKFRLPSWLDEGIAMLFEVSRYEGGLFYFEPGRNLHRLGGLKAAVMKNEMIPLRELIAMNPGEVLAPEAPEGVARFYSQAYALVRFLREEDYGRRLEDYHRLLLGGLRGQWPLSEADRRVAADRNLPLTVWWNRRVGARLFERYIGGDFEQIDEEYVAFCRKIVYHVRFK